MLGIAIGRKGISGNLSTGRIFLRYFAPARWIQPAGIAELGLK
jgi:hypothetical protein